MAKRFFDSRKYQDPWFRKLTPTYKCFWDYLISTCSHTGIWKVDFEMAEFCIGDKLDKKVIKSEFSNRTIELCEEKWFIPKYIDFQYGELNPDAPLHNKILIDLEGILPMEIFKKIRVMSECVQSGITPKAKVKDKVKDIVVSDEDFIRKLINNPAYKTINVEIELSKMDAWLLAHKGRKKTRRFIVNWLNKTDKPVEIKKMEAL